MIPKRNYIILSVLVVLIVFITVFLSLIYMKNEVKEFSYIYDEVSELNSKDLFNYLVETPNCIIYISDKYNLNNNNFERNFINKMQDENLLDLVVFLDYNTNIDYRDLSKPLSHAGLVKLYIEDKYPTEKDFILGNSIIEKKEKSKLKRNKNKIDKKTKDAIEQSLF